MNTGLILVIVTCVVALTFDFINGFHDAANSIATVVSTRVLSPKLAVIWAAFFNFVAAFLLGTAVAKTIGKGMVDLSIVTQYVVLAGLLGAIAWDLLTWWLGPAHLIVPRPDRRLRRSRHRARRHAPRLASLPQRHHPRRLDQDHHLHLHRSGDGLRARLRLHGRHLLDLPRKSPRQVDTWFRKLQLLSAAAYSLGHGGNDAQKTMGIVAGALYTGHIISQYDITHDWGRFHWPIILCAHAAIAAGTYFGGWRIVHTMGSKITKLKPVGGFCAESAGAITLFGTALAGIPVSTTHTITGAIVGVGSIQRLSAVRWGVAAPHCLGLGAHHPCLGCGGWHHLLPDARGQSRRIRSLATANREPARRLPIFFSGRTPADAG